MVSFNSPNILKPNFRRDASLGTIISESDVRYDLLEGEEVVFGVRKPGSVPAPRSLVLPHLVTWGAQPLCHIHQLELLSCGLT